MDDIAYIDGILAPPSRATVPFTDPGVMLGDGVFETMRVRNGQCIRLHQHKQRLLRGAKLLGLDAESSFDEAKDLLLDAAGLDPCTMRITITAGTDGEVRAMGLLRPPLPEGGTVALATADVRLPTASALQGCKPLSMLPYMQALRQAKAKGAGDALILNDIGQVAEASTSNILAMVDGELHAPGASSGAVDGVVARTVRSIAGHDGIATHATLNMDQLRRADAVAISNTTRLLRIVTHIDDKPVSGPGPFEQWQQRLLEMDR